MTIKLVIFDCDGVLVNTEPTTNRIIASSLTEHGLPMRDQEIEEMFVGGTMAGVERTARRMGARLPDDWLDDIYQQMFAALGQGVDVFDGVESLLDLIDAAGIAKAIASNGPMRKMEMSLTPSGLRDRFAGAIYSGHDFTPKPDPHMIHHAMTIAGVAAAETVFIDDSANGCQAGINAGVRTIGYAPRGNAGKLRDLGAEVQTSMHDIATTLGLTVPKPAAPPAIPDHFCPGCGAAQKAFPRYPWHVCKTCRDTAEDKAGNRLSCFNTHPGGGFGFQAEGSTDRYSCRGIVAFINKRRVYITEARFGGTVAQPIRDDDPICNGNGVADLTHPVDAPRHLTPLPSDCVGRVKPASRR